MEKSAGHLHIGETLDTNSGDRNGNPVLIDSADLTTHGVIVGMTGSGKTGLGMVLLEEALLAKIPVLAIDPKGDLGNLCLTFPNLEAADFEPWVDEGEARLENSTVSDLAAAKANLWSKGLEGWGLDKNNIAELKAAASPIIYTPGGTAGVPLDILGRLAVPSVQDAGARQEEADSTVSGLLGLVDVTSDPIAGREHILLANLIIKSWADGNDLDLASLIGQIIDPPIRKLGVIEIDAFFPAKDRQALAMRLNGLLASPSFAAWSKGQPLEIEKMLWDENGKPRAAIASLAHLSETERSFAVTVLLSKLISWMRKQPGTGQLRCLVYIDEVMGLAPPVGNPSTKKPILTLLKQARAFGVGLVLSTQNPVDLDYKAISNAGTWMIGRLQTEQDKKRLVDGLRSADGSVDINQLEATISALGKRQFVLRTTKSSATPLLTSRWAMSYLAGPLTNQAISDLMADTKAKLAAASAPTEPQTGAEAINTQLLTSSKRELSDNESALAPKTPPNLPVSYVSKDSPWLDQVGGSSTGTALRAMLATRVKMLFDDTKSKLRHTEEWEAIIPIEGSEIDVDAALAIDFDDRDFKAQGPAEAVYIMPEAELKAAAIKKVAAAVKDKLYTGETVKLRTNPELKLWSRPGEPGEEFARRCNDAAEDQADAETAKIRDRIEKKIDRVEAALAKAEDRVAETEIQSKGRKQQQVVDLGASVLGSLLGGRSRTRSLASAARRATSGGRQKASAEARVETARNRVADKIDELEDLEADLSEAVIEIDEKWLTISETSEEVEIPLEKTDITVQDLRLIWVPIER